jgi:class 3 adenylate cyclase
VHSAIEEASSTEPAGELTLKGIMRPVRIFNVCGLQTVPA